MNDNGMIASAPVTPEPCCEKDYKRPRMELLREYPIRITFMSLGCVIEVGCKSIPFSNVADGMSALSAYINNPYEERKRWEEKMKQADNQ